MTEDIKHYNVPFEHTVGIAIPASVETYHSRFIAEIRRQLGEHTELDIQQTTFDCGTPLGIVESAEHVVLLHVVNDNFGDMLSDLMILGDAYKGDSDAAGPNCRRLGLVIFSMEGRQDQKRRKSTDNGNLIVQGQQITTRALANFFSGTVHADYIVTTDFHSRRGADDFTNKGIDFINVTAAKEFSESLLESGTLQKADPSWCIATTDIGGLNSAFAFQQYLDLDIVILGKNRKALEAMTESSIEQKLLYGSVENRNVLLVDDVVDGAGTLAGGTTILRNKGAKQIVACFTSPEFTGDYYNILQGLLDMPEVIQILTTDILPMRRVGRGDIAMPYSKVFGTEKKVKQISLSQKMAEIIQVLQSTHSLEDAKKILRPHIWNLQYPSVLYKQLTNEELPVTPDIGVYRKGNKVILFNDLDER